MCHVELVESRRLLSTASVTLSSKGTLLIVGTEARDVVSITSQSDEVIVVANGVQRSFAVSEVRRVRADGLGGNDSIISDAAEFATTLDGGAGNDVLTCAGRATLVGGDGSDELNAGEAGVLVIPGGGDDRSTGSNITLDYSAAESPLLFRNEIEIDPSTGAEILFAAVRIGDERDILPADGAIFDLMGTAFDDTFNLAFSPASQRRFFGGLGNDSFVAGEYEAAVFGGPGNDTFDCSTNASSTGELNARALTFDGGPGEDRWLVRFVGDFQPNSAPQNTLGLGRDVIDFSEFTGSTFISLAENSAEQLTAIGTHSPMAIVGSGRAERFTAAGPNAVTISGSGGSDTVVGSARPDSIMGGSGSDHLEGRSGSDTISGDSDRDFIHGGSGDDHLFGGSGDDRMTGGGGRDVLNGQSGDDMFYAQDARVDSVFGGIGFDRAFVDDSSVVEDVVDGVEQLN
ncbi:MAG TPA: calcium-binding protein [Tepidisphaeraceae bacterium]|nr:calcium-binding protein [Tepidisphaeraceae bacterium]